MVELDLSDELIDKDDHNSSLLEFWNQTCWNVPKGIEELICGISLYKPYQAL